MDTLSPEQRSERMGRIRAKDTKPELVVRSLLSSMGCRYRLHRRNLPGVPDIVFPAKKRAIFVHGCFWHQHKRCRYSHVPKSRKDFWVPKLIKNQKRDKENLCRLRSSGWKVLVVWECQTSGVRGLKERLGRFLSTPERGAAHGASAGYGSIYVH